MVIQYLGEAASGFRHSASGFGPDRTSDPGPLARSPKPDAAFSLSLPLPQTIHHPPHHRPPIRPRNSRQRRQKRSIHLRPRRLHMQNQIGRQSVRGINKTTTTTHRQGQRGRSTPSSMQAINTSSAVKSRSLMQHPPTRSQCPPERREDKTAHRSPPAAKRFRFPLCDR